MKKERSKPNDPLGWDFQDHLEVLLYPQSRAEAIKNFIITWIMFIPIIGYIFLSFLICGLVGLINSKGKGVIK